MASSENKVNKSKKETFSNINIDNDHNFQTANMEYKMKKIKKNQSLKLKTISKILKRLTPYIMKTLIKKNIHQKKMKKRNLQKKSKILIH